MLRAQYRREPEARQIFPTIDFTVARASIILQTHSSPARFYQNNACRYIYIGAYNAPLNVFCSMKSRTICIHIHGRPKEVSAQIKQEAIIPLRCSSSLVRDAQREYIVPLTRDIYTYICTYPGSGPLCPKGRRFARVTR